jgi:hypothetical protein
VRKRPDGRVLVAGVEAVEVLLARAQDRVVDAVVHGEVALRVGDDVLPVQHGTEVLIATDLDLQTAGAFQPPTRVHSVAPVCPCWPEATDWVKRPPRASGVPIDWARRRPDRGRAGGHRRLPRP